MWYCTIFPAQLQHTFEKQRGPEVFWKWFLGGGSFHTQGEDLEAIVPLARESVKRHWHVQPPRVYFTKGYFHLCVCTGLCHLWKINSKSSQRLSLSLTFSLAQCWFAISFLFVCLLGSHIISSGDQGLLLIQSLRAAPRVTYVLTGLCSDRNWTVASPNAKQRL